MQSYKSVLFAGGAASVILLAYGSYSYRRNLKLKEAELEKIKLELEAEKGNSFIFKLKMTCLLLGGCTTIYAYYRLKKALVHP